VATPLPPTRVRTRSRDKNAATVSSALLTSRAGNRLLLSAPGLLLVSWCALVAALLLVRHVHSPVLPAASAFEIAPAYQLGSTDVLTIIFGLIGAAVLAGVLIVSRQSDHLLPIVTPRLVSWRTLIIATTIGVGLITFVTLFRRLPTATDCAASRIYHLNSHMGFVWNCDSSVFQQVSANPLKLFEEGQPRQSRPVYAFIGAILVYTVGRVLGWIGLGHFDGEDARPFLSLVILNVLVLIAAAVLFVRLLLRLGTPPVVTAALTVPIALNTVTAEWLLTPHQQTFSMLVPVVTVIAARQALLKPPGWRMAAWWGLAVGLGTLAYGSWLLTVVVIAVALVIKLRKAAVRPVLSFVGGVAAPVLAWMALCYAVVGSYYNHEIHAYREFVWPLDPGPSDLWHRSTSYMLLTLREFLGTPELWVTGGVLAVGIIVAAVRRVSLSPSTDEDRALLWSIGLTQGLTVVFLWGIGYYTTRLSVALIPPLLILAGWIFARIAAASSRAWTGRVLTVASAVAVVGWTGLILTLA
jgi:hypothetical protein